MIFQRINFHDNVLPVFKENKAKGYVTFGADNLYPDFLIELFNKSPKHNAIASSGVGIPLNNWMCVCAVNPFLIEFK